MSKSIVVGTAGHIDHGKSSLVKTLTGTDPDRLKEEKARGITIDLGFAHADVGDVSLAFVDVPGHERFVKNMLAGVGGIDAVLLVIAADESVMPQTREHFAICRLLDVPAGVIALTKADLVDRGALEIAALEARELVAGSRLADAPIVAVSARTGEGIDRLRAALVSVAAGTAVRGSDGPPRLPIDRVFSMRGFGTVVTGTLIAGTLRVDDELEILPSGRRVKVRGLQEHGAPQRTALAGRRVAVNLGGIDTDDVERGQTLTAAGALEVTRRFDAEIELLPSARALRHGARVRFHCGTTELLARVAIAWTSDDDRGGREAAAVPARGAEVRPGERAGVRIRLEAPAVLTRGDRFILRQYSPAITIGGGRVLDPVPARTAIRTPAGRARFARLAGTSEDAARWFIDERRGAGLTAAALRRRAGVPPPSGTHAVGDELFSMPLVAAFDAALIAEVTTYHAAHPMAEGIPREEARERVFGHASRVLFDDVVQRLTGEGRLSGRERLALPGRGVSLSPEESVAREALDRIYREAGLAPPDLATAAAAARVVTAVAERVSKLLIRQKTLLKLDALLFHQEALERLKREVTAMKGQGSPAKVDVAGFKQRYGISRKYAIPLLEWLDRERVTRRVGEARIVL